MDYFYERNIVEIKNEYTTFLINIITPFVYEGIRSVYSFALNAHNEFIEKGNKVKISIRMRGREITHLELAKEMMENILKATEEFSKPEVNPRLEGMQMVVILVKK